MSATAPVSSRWKIQGGSGILLLVQAVLFGLVPLTHARAEAQALHSAVHIEAERTSACVALHSDDNCLTCRFLSTFANPAKASTRNVAASPVRHLATSSDQAPFVYASRFPASQSRAPPLHS